LRVDKFIVIKNGAGFWPTLCQC